MVDKFVVIRWLLSHVSVLREISAIVAAWSDQDSLSHKLEIVYKVAQALLPVIETFPLFQAQAVTPEEAEEDLKTVEAMMIPVPILLNVIAPIVVSLVRILLSKRDE